jgi:hypothetical protein
MVFTPLASLPSGNDLKRISKNVGLKAEKAMDLRVRSEADF